jgi:hypothetical protein
MLKTITVVAILAASPAFAKSCDRLVAEDTKAMQAATAHMMKACKNDSMAEACTKAIEAGDKALAASDALDLKCPKVTWSYDPPPSWKPE